MRRALIITFVLLVAGLLPSTAHAQQTLTFSIGGFVPGGEDARIQNGHSDDVLVNNLDFLSFNIKDFVGANVNVEYTVALGDYLDAGLGAGFYERSVPSTYADFVDDSGFEVRQELKLRIIPMTATIRFLPLGHHRGIQPFIGGGLGVFNWRYAETGEFIFADGTVDPGNFVGSGTATGPVVLGGVKIPFGQWGVGTEIRYQNAHGDLPADEDFSADRIDLSGWTYLATVHVRF